MEIKRYDYFIERSLGLEVKEFWLKQWMIPVCWTNADGTVYVKENLLENLSDEELLELMRITNERRIDSTQENM